VQRYFPLRRQANPIQDAQHNGKTLNFGIVDSLGGFERLEADADDEIGGCELKPHPVVHEGAEEEEQPGSPGSEGTIEDDEWDADGRA